MNSLLSVSAGSKYPGYLIELRLKKVRKEKPMALVGKGITFDSGGISLKRPHKMGAMKTDMLGSATVLGIIDYLAQIKCRRNVIGFMAIAENMPGPNATRPGDIVKSYSGKTIEILDTDAEGRLVLADALAYAEKTHKPRTIIDFATLTGQQDSVSCALFASLMGTDETLNKELLEMSEKTNEKLVEFPLYQEYIDHTKSDIADVKNYEFGCNSGMIHAGAFLSNFIDRKKVKWAHLDIAGPARMEGMPSAYGVRLVSEYILQ
jgi:leucyl aminopeptidase